MLPKKLKTSQITNKIVLIGFSGSGKTTVSKELAKLLKLPLYSVDEQIEKRENKKIPLIFTEKGEPYFRKVETEAISDLTSKDSGIIDCGGGVVENPLNMELLKKWGTILWFDCPLDVILQRTKESDRPLLSGKDPTEIQEFFSRRTALYSRYSEYEVNSSKDIQEVITDVAQIVQNKEID